MTTDLTTSPDQTPTNGSGQRSRRNRDRRPFALSNFTGIYILAAFIVVFALWIPTTFLTSLTAQTIMAEQAVTAMVAIGLLFALAAGQYDLSIGAVVGLSAVMVCTLTTKYGISLVPAVLITVLVGTTVGVINAFLVVKVGISSFIATLGMSSVLIAPTRAISGDQVVYGVPEAFIGLTAHQALGIPVIALYMLVVATIAWYALEHTPFGRRVAATGSGPDAARLAGVRTERVIFASLMISSTVAALAGVLLASKLATATPDLGPGYLLPAFAAAFLGTTQLKPGRFNVWGTLIAIFLLATGVKGLQLAGAADWVTDLFNGAALIIAVGLSLWSNRVDLKALKKKYSRRTQSTFARPTM